MMVDPTKNQTQEDIEMINRIVFSYISDPHMAILFVATGPQNYMNTYTF